MYVIKATQKAPSYSHGNKKLLAATKCCSGTILAQKCCRKNKRWKASSNPPCIKTIKHNKFHNVKSVACSFFCRFSTCRGEIQENDMKGTQKSCRTNAGGILEKKKTRGNGGKIKPPFGKSFLCGQERIPFWISLLTKTVFSETEESFSEKLGSVVSSGVWAQRELYHLSMRREKMTGLLLPRVVSQEQIIYSKSELKFTILVFPTSLG